MTATRSTVSRNGQISIPAHLRHRWGTRSMLVIDRGDYAIVRPIPEDPIEALHGAHSGSGPAAEEVRDADRETDRAIEQRRTAQY
jgi:AbrB family looped-hinge helix DNA binding protein